MQSLTSRESSAVPTHRTRASEPPHPVPASGRSSRQASAGGRSGSRAHGRWEKVVTGDNDI